MQRRCVPGDLSKLEVEDAFRDAAGELFISRLRWSNEFTPGTPLSDR
jgi:hypothetical protein